MENVMTSTPKFMQIKKFKREITNVQNFSFVGHSSNELEGAANSL